jgi:RNA:NAD 2'-phosphotransferase (TPT1/KptA family)
MSNVETLFNPRDDSLAEKVKAYYDVCRDYHRVQASLKHTQQGKQSDYIGDHEEVLSASQMISQSLTHASKAVSNADLQQAKDKGFINDSQLVEMVQLQRQSEMQQTRQQQNTSDSDSSRFQR